MFKTVLLPLILDNISYVKLVFITYTRASIMDILIATPEFTVNRNADYSHS